MGGAGRCIHEAEETDGTQGELAGRYPEGKTPDFIRGEGDCVRGEKSKKKKGKKFTEFAREKTEEESMDQCISQEAKMNNDIKKKPSLSD